MTETTPAAGAAAAASSPPALEPTDEKTPAGSSDSPAAEGEGEKMQVENENGEGEEEDEEQDEQEEDEDGEEDAGGEDSDEYEYVYDDGDDGGYDDDAGVASGAARGGSAANHVVFTGLDTIGCTNDMLLKKELTRLKGDLEKTQRWKVDLTWAEETRTLGVLLEHEGFIKAHLNLSFPANYPSEPPEFKWLGPRFDDTVDFVLAADVFEPCRKENWNDTFTCTSLLMVVMELVKDKYPITDELAWDEFEAAMVAICKSRLPGVPKKVKEGLVYFGVRLEPREKAAKRSSGVGYSNGARAGAHDFSVHDAKFQEHLAALRKFLEMSREATSVMLARVAHIHFGAWLLQYLEEELPIFKYEEVAGLIDEAVALLGRISPDCEELPRIRQIHADRGALLQPDARCLRATSAEGKAQQEAEEAEEYVFSVEDEFPVHNYGPGGPGGQPAGAPPVTPSMEVMKRIMLEVENLRDHLRGMTDGQIYVCFSEASILLWKVLIIPSSGTPYYGGCFEFHLSIPPTYPNHPPKCLFMTTGGGQVRFNPNLYHNGKVCLSLLGTWSGEPWDPAHSNLSQLLISILAFIFTTEPLRNEPGLEQSADKTVAFYNAYIRLETLETAMLQALKSPPTEFADVTKRHFRRAWHSLVRPDLLAWAERHDFPDVADANQQSCAGQITRMNWFRGALGPGNYKKMMLAAVAHMDEMVASLGPAPPNETGGGVVAADIRDEKAVETAGGGGGKSAAAASSSSSAAAAAAASSSAAAAAGGGGGKCKGGAAK